VVDRLVIKLYVSKMGTFGDEPTTCTYWHNFLNQRIRPNWEAEFTKLTLELPPRRHTCQAESDEEEEIEAD
jgi:hypothetical protein